MNATSEKQTVAWLNPDVLRWAREWSGHSLEEAAKRVGKSADQVGEWELGKSLPTVRQARLLAEFYGRPFLEFFLPAPPELLEPSAIPDYRVHADHDRSEDRRKLDLIQQWAETQRVNALDLYQEIGEEPPSFPLELRATLQNDPGKIAARTREILNLSIQDQISMTKAASLTLPAILRRQYESNGILVLRTPDLKPLRVRGICIAEFPLPVIVYSTESPTAQAFTLVHELAHVILRQSGVTGPRSRAYDRQPVERWCDQFAAAFLMPFDQVVAIIGEKPAAPLASIQDDELARFAEIFRVSPHAMLIRLVHLGYVRASFYWDIKKPEFDRIESNYQSFARASYYASRFRSSLGDLYTRLVLEAWSADRITNHSAAQYMGIKDFVHLEAIRDHFGVS